MQSATPKGVLRDDRANSESLLETSRFTMARGKRVSSGAFEGSETRLLLTLLDRRVYISLKNAVFGSGITETKQRFHVAFSCRLLDSF